MQHSNQVHIIIRADKKILIETAASSGDFTVIDLEALIAEKQNQDQQAKHCREQQEFHAMRQAMRQAKGFINNLSNLPMRKSLACIVRGVAVPLISDCVQKVKTVGVSRHE